jgi:hypothetical protein
VLCVGAAAQNNGSPQPPSGDGIVITKLSEDTSVIEFRPMVIDYIVNQKSSRRYHAIFKASFMTSVKAPVVSNFVTIWFHSTSRVCRYPSGHFNMLVRTDSETIRINSDIRGAKSGDVVSTFSEPEGGCVESLWAHLHPGTWYQPLANLKAVAWNLCGPIFGKKHFSRSCMPKE